MSGSVRKSCRPALYRKEILEILQGHVLVAGDDKLFFHISEFES